MTMFLPRDEKGRFVRRTLGHFSRVRGATVRHLSKLTKAECHHPHRFHKIAYDDDDISRYSHISRSRSRSQSRSRSRSSDSYSSSIRGERSCQQNVSPRVSRRPSREKYDDSENSIVVVNREDCVARSPSFSRRGRNTVTFEIESNDAYCRGDTPDMITVKKRQMYRRGRRHASFHSRSSFRGRRYNYGCRKIQ